MPNAAPKKEHNVHIIDVPETHRDNTYKEETTYDEELATNDKEIAAAALAIYDEEIATLASYGMETAAATLAH